MKIKMKEIAAGILLLGLGLVGIAGAKVYRDYQRKKTFHEFVREVEEVEKLFKPEKSRVEDYTPPKTKPKMEKPVRAVEIEWLTPSDLVKEIGKPVAAYIQILKDKAKIYEKKNELETVVSEVKNGITKSYNVGVNYHKLVRNLQGIPVGL